MRNKTIIEFIRAEIKSGMALLPKENHRIFKLMYSHKDLDKDINAVVDDIPDDKLDWALTQVQRTLGKRDFKTM